MTRVMRLAKLAQLQRSLQAASSLVEEIRDRRLLAKLAMEEPQRWDRLSDQLRLTELPSTEGGLIRLLLTLNDFVEQD